MNILKETTSQKFSYSKFIIGSFRLDFWFSDRFILENGFAFEEEQKISTEDLISTTLLSYVQLR